MARQKTYPLIQLRMYAKSQAQIFTMELFLNKWICVGQLFITFFTADMYYRQLYDSSKAEKRYKNIHHFSGKCLYSFLFTSCDNMFS